MIAFGGGPNAAVFGVPVQTGLIFRRFLAAKLVPVAYGDA
jgi:hypothetical protein